MKHMILVYNAGSKKMEGCEMIIYLYYTRITPNCSGQRNNSDYSGGYFGPGLVAYYIKMNKKKMESTIIYKYFSFLLSEVRTIRTGFLPFKFLCNFGCSVNTTS